MNENAKTPDNKDKNIDRRNFIKIIIGGLSSLMALSLGWPMMSFIFKPIFQKKNQGFVKVPGFTSLPENRVTNMGFQFIQEDSFFKLDQVHHVWVIKHAADRATVFSSICTHLGCRVDWQVDWQKFVCPCHGSVFSADGKVVSGPAPRPLDTLVHKIEGGELYVQWEDFKSGVPQKVEI